MADGSVTIECLAETSKFDKQMNRIDKEIDKREKQKVKIDTQILDYEDQIHQFEVLEAKAEEYRHKLNQMKDNRADDGSIKQMQLQYDDVVRTLDKQYPTIEKIKGKLNELKLKQQENVAEVEQLEKQYNRVKTEKLKDGIKGFKDNLQESGSAIGTMIGKVGKLALAVFSVRGAYMLVRQAVATISQYDETFAANLEYIKYALSMTIAPILNWIVSIIATIFQYINQIASLWFGITGGLFKSANAFKSAKNSMSGMAKSAKEINKQLAGFDEMNILQDNSSSGGGGGGGTMPSIDLADATGLKDFNPIKWLKDILEKVRNWIYSIDWQELGSSVYEGIKSFFTDIDWAGIFDSVFETIGAILGGIAGFVVGFLSDAWTDISNYFTKWIDEATENGHSVIYGLLLGIGNAVYNIGAWIYEHIFKPFIDGFKKAFGIASPSKVMEEQGIFIIDGLKEGIGNIWEKLKEAFENFKTKILETFSKIWENIKKVFEPVGEFMKEKFNNAFTKIKEVFNPIINFFSDIWNRIKSKLTDFASNIGTTIGNAFRGVINGVLNAIENILNVPIRGLNSLISVINGIPGVSIGYLSTIYIPRLAKGGIVNLPNRGVGVGSAIAGESGAEGVIPLTDSQAMETLGEAIGRYITINANIVNSMNGRIIGREIKRITGQQAYASNI